MDNKEFNTILKKAAEMLVECEYGHTFSFVGSRGYWMQRSGLNDGSWVEPFSDTLEGRKQLDALFWYMMKGRDMFYLDGLGHLDHREQMIDFVKAELSK